MYKSSADAVREFLVAYRANEERIDSELDKIRMLRARVMSVGAKPLSNMPRAPSGSGDPMAAYIIRLEALESGIKKELAIHKAARKAIEGAIKNLKKDEQMVIKCRYLYGYDWSDVLHILFNGDPKFAANRDTFRRRMYRVHEEALKKMAADWGNRNIPL